MIGKIAKLPPAIQEQLNQRLEKHEPASTILPWLNSQPEVKEVLKAEFNGARISQQNLSEHRRRAFREWQDRLEAIDFATTLNQEDSALQRVVPADLTDKLARWVSLRYAAAAKSISTSRCNSGKSLRQIRDLCFFTLALRRGELSARRAAMEQERLALEKSILAQEQEKTFWEWTKRPEIQGKLYPHRDPDKEYNRMIDVMDAALCGDPPPERPPEDTSSPAILI
jgi:hypothetical protein